MPRFTSKAILLLCVVAVVGAAAYLSWKLIEAHHPLKPAARGVPVVQVVPVVPKTLFREEQLPAEIEAYQDVLIYPKVPGFIDWIGVDRGSVVRKDQLMVKMYAPEYLARRNEGLARVAAARARLAAEESVLQDLQADLRKRRANLLADQSTYERLKAAAETPGVVATNDVIQWAQTVEVDRQDVNAMIKRVNAKNHEVAVRREDLQAEMKAYESVSDMASYLEIRAPFNGYVTDRRMHVGSFVGPDGTGAYLPICRVKQLDLLRVVAPVPEKDVAGVLVGSQVKFSVSAFPGRTFIGILARISNTLDRATRAMPVELNYFNPKYEVLPGSFCQVYWPIRRREPSLFVPVTAVVTTQLDTFVCKVQDDIVHWVTVTKGQIMNGMVEVFGDLHEGDLVAKEASEELQDQSKVRPVPVRLSDAPGSNGSTRQQVSMTH